MNNGKAAPRSWTVAINFEFPRGVIPAKLLDRLRRAEARVDRLSLNNQRDLGQLVWALETLAARVGRVGRVSKPKGGSDAKA